MSYCQPNVPSQQDVMIIFPQGIGGGAPNNSDAYSPILTDGRVSLEEINQVLQDVQAIWKPYNQRIFKVIYWLLLVELICIGGFIAWNLSHRTASSNNIFLGVFVFIIVMLAIAIVFALKIRDIIIQSRIAVQAYFTGINPKFAERGLRWSAPINFPKWVGLWKDYKSQQVSGEARYIPPPMQPYGSYEVPSQIKGEEKYQENFSNNYQSNNTAEYKQYT